MKIKFDLWAFTAYQDSVRLNRPFAWDFWNGGYKDSELFWPKGEVLADNP